MNSNLDQILKEKKKNYVVQLRKLNQHQEKSNFRGQLMMKDKIITELENYIRSNQRISIDKIWYFVQNSNRLQNAQIDCFFTEVLQFYLKVMSLNNKQQQFVIKVLAMIVKVTNAQIIQKLLQQIMIEDLKMIKQRDLIELLAQINKKSMCCRDMIITEFKDYLVPRLEFGDNKYFIYFCESIFKYPLTKSLISKIYALVDSIYILNVQLPCSQTLFLGKLLLKLQNQQITEKILQRGYFKQVFQKNFKSYEHLLIECLQHILEVTDSIPFDIYNILLSSQDIAVLNCIKILINKNYQIVQPGQIFCICIQRLTQNQSESEIVIVNILQTVYQLINQYPFEIIDKFIAQSSFIDSLMNILVVKNSNMLTMKILDIIYCFLSNQNWKKRFEERGLAKQLKTLLGNLEDPTLINIVMCSLDIIQST